MKIKLLALILFLVNILALNAQDFPKGIYMSIDEVQNKEPSLAYTLLSERRTIGEIKMSGGNDYRISSTTKLISKKDIKKNIAAYSNGDTLFLNCFKYNIQLHYTPVLKHGRYLFFVAGISQDENMYNYQIQESETSTFWSKVGGGIGGAIYGAKVAQLRFPYLVDLESNELTYLNDFGLEELLAKNSLALLKRYREEKNSNDIPKSQLVLKYVDKLNELE